MTYGQFQSRQRTHWDVPQLRCLRHAPGLLGAAPRLADTGGSDASHHPTPEHPASDSAAQDRSAVDRQDPTARDYPTDRGYYAFWDDVHRKLMCLSTGADGIPNAHERDLFSERAYANCPPESARLAITLLASMIEAVGVSERLPKSELTSIKKNIKAMKDLWRIDRAHMVRLVQEAYGESE